MITNQNINSEITYLTLSIQIILQQKKNHEYKGQSQEECNDEWCHYLSWVKSNLIGPPKATTHYTVTQLERIKMVGIYSPKDTNYKCGSCGATGVRLYRNYGKVRFPEDDRCNYCMESIAFMVPCVLNEEGKAWKFGSEPTEVCQHFYNLPEKQSGSPYWKEGIGWK